MSRSVAPAIDGSVLQKSTDLLSVGEAYCNRCRRLLDGSLRFSLGGGRCLRCTLRYRPLLRRSVLTALVVGSLLVAINQGATMLTGSLPGRLVWQIPMTYAVPFCVATWGALVNSRVGREKVPPS
jgi:hypothetical protein